MKKTLGGDRLGSGKRMQVELHGYERSTHDLGYLWRSTMSAGTLVPFLKEVALPGDTFDIDLDCDIKTHPTIGPLFGSYKVQLDIFQCPIRLYQGQLHNNKLGIGMNMAAIKLPLMGLLPTITNDAAPDPENSQINPSCIHSYLGIRGVGSIQTDDTNTIRYFNAVPLIAYWDIYKNYYANKQEELGAVVHTDLAALVETIVAIDIDGTNLPEEPARIMKFIDAPITITIDWATTAPILNQIIINTDNGQYSAEQLVQDGTLVVGLNITTFTLNLSAIGNAIWFSWQYIAQTDTPVGPPEVATFDLENLDTMREEILHSTDDPDAFVINAQDLEPYKWVLDFVGERNPMLNTQEGLAIKTYQSDLFNNWLSTEWIDGAGGINEITAIDTSGGSFSIDTLNLSKKVYDMLNRIAVSGGTYDDWLDAVYTHDRWTRAETPIYHGGLIKELVFQEVVSNSESTPESGATQPLGTLAGKGVMGKKHKGGKVTIKVDEPSYLIGIISLTPRIDYSQGNKWDVNLKTMDDFHKPALDEIGFQELITEQMAWWTTKKAVGAGTVYNQQSAGKQPAWINYMTNVNEVRGNFAVKTNEMFMTLNRRYEKDDADILDLTTYIDPVKFNHIFANTAIDAQNFWAQVAIDITARRKMSAKIMPNL